MLGRLLLYIREMFPLERYIPYSIVSYFGLYLITQVLAGKNHLIITVASIYGFLTVLFMMLLMRVFDEFKDYETDKVLFPNRPVARGAVKLTDLRFLGILLIIMMAAVNFCMGWVLLVFGAMLLFSFLTYKWFFFRNLIQNNLILALITHQPFILFVNTYIIATALFTIGTFDFSSGTVISCLIYFFPITAWETSRKIRSTGRETEYVTYSRLFGPQKATLLPLVSLLVTGGLLIVLGINLHFHGLYLLAVALLMVVYLFMCIRFIINPSEPNNVLKKYAELLGILFLIVILIQIIVKYDITFALVIG